MVEESLTVIANSTWFLYQKNSMVPPPVQLRVDMINGVYDLTETETEFMRVVCNELAQAAQNIMSRAPPHCDTGRLIAFSDALLHAKHIAHDAVIIGSESKKRAAA